MFMEAGDYRTELRDANDQVIWTDDPVSQPTPASVAESAATMRNRLVNGGMQISQENGVGNVNVTTGNVYMLDQWVAMLSAAPGGTVRVAQEVFATPGGNRERLRAAVQVADAALAAGDFYAIATPLQGYSVADARWGTAGRKQVILRFGVRSSVPGTYCVSIANGLVGTRSWVGTYSIGASEVGVDLVREFVIPGDASGTWASDTAAGMVVRWCLGTGTTYQGAAGWQAGDILATSAQVNWMGTINETFRIFDVAFYIDTAAVGKAPPYEVPDYTTELMRCLPFWRWMRTTLQFPAAGVATHSAGYVFAPPMRAIPAISMTATVDFAANVDAAYPQVGEISQHGASVFLVSAGAGDCADRGRLWRVSSRY